MAQMYLAPSAEPASSAVSLPRAPLDLLPHQPVFDSSDLPSFVVDFFSWLEEVWQLPVQPGCEERLRPPEYPQQDATALYTMRDLSQLWGYSKDKVQSDFQRLDVHSSVEQRADNPEGYKREHLFCIEDFAKVISLWKNQRFFAWVNACWSRFTPDPCGACYGCRGHAGRQRAKRVIYCETNHWWLQEYRQTFNRFLRALQFHGSVADCWKQEGNAFWTASEPPEVRGLILIYLLDRRMLQLSPDEMSDILPNAMRSPYYLRPWRNRRPEEYATFTRALEEEGYGPDTIHRSCIILVIFVLLRYGLPGVAELRRSLSADEIAQVVQERRLVTLHLGHGTYLPCTLTNDIRVGHVILDEIRHSFWRYGATHELQVRNRFSQGPRYYRFGQILAIERALTSKVWQNGEAILALRPEIDGKLHNPYAELPQADYGKIGFPVLPLTVQETILEYIRYRYQEQRVAPTTLEGDMSTIIPFFSWLCQLQVQQSDYRTWDREEVRTIMRTYLTTRCSHLRETTRYAIVSKLYTFFRICSKWDCPFPLATQ